MGEEKLNYLNDPMTDVIVKTGTYKGWKNSFVGMGRMVFVKGNDTIEVKEDVGGSPDWMEQCWHKFIKEVKKRENDHKIGKIGRVKSVAPNRR